MDEDAKYLAKTKASEMDVRTKISTDALCALYSSNQFEGYRRDVLIENAVEIADELIERLVFK